MNKKEARLYVKEISQTFKEEDLKKETEEILKKIESNPRFKRARTVGIYYPIQKEFNITSLLKKYPNKDFYFPKTHYRMLSFRKVVDLNTLVDGPYGLKEPSLDHEPLKTIDLYIIPCVATANNYRIGHGAGFYDFYFKVHQGYKIGIVHPRFKDLDVEVNDHDIPMDEIL